MKFPPLNEQMDRIKKNVEEIIPEDEMEEKIVRSIKTGEPLKVKLGADPSRPDLHLGHSVVLRKMRDFQDLGHQVILVIGDFTGMIGDPSGRSKTRPSLTLEETRRNGESYFRQASLILNPDTVKIVYNSQWLGKMKFQEVIILSSKYTVARMLERDDFSNRYRNGEPISIHELLYPLAQAMDSVALHADVELGGTDQKFNLLVGREIQREYGQEPQVIITFPLLEGTDGKEKMSKSFNNYIALTDPPEEMYGKTMSIPDSLIGKYFKLLTNLSTSELELIEKQLKSHDINPRDLKRRLARELVRMYHSSRDANQSQEKFDKIFVQKGIPEDIPQFSLREKENVSLVSILVDAQMVKSASEARRLIQQGAVKIDGEPIKDIYYKIRGDREKVVKIGKRRFLRVIS
jgi:tyrosyl-tRNA synthetase